MNETLKKINVHGTITLPFSVEVTANNEDEAQTIAQYLLNDLTIQQVYLNLLTTNGQIISPHVHDHDVTVEAVFED